MLPLMTNRAAFCNYFDSAGFTIDTDTTVMSRTYSSATYTYPDYKLLYTN